MPLTPFPVEQFGGLNLAIDPTELGMSGATALSNVDFEAAGQIRTRNGYTSLTATATAPRRVHLYQDDTAGTFQAITSSTTKLEAFHGLTGASVASVAATGPHSMVTFGAAATPVVYTVSQGDGLVRKWTGAAWSTPIAKGGTALAIANRSDRLVIAGDGTTGSRVWFSDPGAPETIGANNFVDITPGDGERIQNAASWQDYTFVFKRTTFAVFTGESTLSDGSPVFNYRMYRGHGVPEGVGHVCVAPHGVYFLGSEGHIWLTTGGAPVMVSEALAPLFGTTTTALSLGVNSHLYWYRGRLFAVLAAVFGSPNPRTFVYWPAANVWSEWSFMTGKSGGGFGAALGNSDTLYFVNGTDLALYTLGPSWTTDNGTAIAWSYTTGYSSAGGYFRQRIVSSGERKKHFKTDILGSGTVTHQVLALNGRPNDVADTGGSVTLGTSPAIARGSRRRGVRGTYFAHKLSGSGPAVVSGLTYWLSEISLDT